MKTSAHLVPLKYFSLSIVFLLCLSTPLFAQEEGEIEKITQAEEFLFGEEMIVSAAKHEESLLRSPSAVTVIAAEELREYGIRDLVDALRLVPGLDVQAMSPSNTTVNIRRSAHIANWPVLFLIDGRKMTFDIMGFTIIETLPVSIEDIERIEVMRGPGSALYGAALSGIINIITKDPAKTNGFLLDAAGGNFNTRQITIRTAGGTKIPCDTGSRPQLTQQTAGRRISGQRNPQGPQRAYYMTYLHLSHWSSRPVLTRHRPDQLQTWAQSVMTCFSPLPFSTGR